MGLASNMHGIYYMHREARKGINRDEQQYSGSIPHLCFKCSTRWLNSDTVTHIRHRIHV
jgi:hypothetical protein